MINVCLLILLRHSLFLLPDPDDLSVPSAPPGMVAVAPDFVDPQRLMLSWGVLTCTQLRAPWVSYIVEYGRLDGLGGVRTLNRRGLKVRSNNVDNDLGLGILDKGVNYFFRVAVENVNGVGPFSDPVFAQSTGERSYLVEPWHTSQI